MYNYLIKKRNEKGFTLMEVLIVVAIIAILIAISIPVFTNQLEKAREATDDANERAAKGMAVAMYLTGVDDAGNHLTFPTTFNYDAVKGKLTKAEVTPGYGKGTTVVGTTGGTHANDHTTADTGVVVVTIATDGTVSTEWNKGGAIS